MIQTINNYSEFTDALLTAGMSVGGENDEGVFSLCSYFGKTICWHTEDMETDPWEWRMRVLNERDDIAYGKLFFKKSGYITKEWYPYFYAVRRRGITFEEAYENGTISNDAKRIYQLLSEQGSMPLHLIKQSGNYTKENKSRFDRAITELQMKMYITMCGKARKQSKQGEEYGWSSTVFCPVEDYFEEEVFMQAEKLTYHEAYEKIQAKIISLNPLAKPEKIRKFIVG